MQCEDINEYSYFFIIWLYFVPSLHLFTAIANMSDEDFADSRPGGGPESSDDDGRDTEETRSMVRDQNRKKKKSGGFQSMGESCLPECVGCRKPIYDWMQKACHLPVSKPLYAYP